MANGSVQWNLILGIVDENEACNDIREIFNQEWKFYEIGNGDVELNLE